MFGLSALGKSGRPLDVLIPAIPLMEIFEGVEESDFLGVGSDHLAGAQSDAAKQLFRQQADMIEAQRVTVQQIFATEIDPSQALSDRNGEFGPPKFAEHLSNLVSEMILVGGDIPFEVSADRMREILGRSHDETSPRAAVTRTATSQIGQTSVGGDFGPADETLQRTDLPLKAIGGELTHRRGLAEAVSTESGSAAGYRATSNDRFQARDGQNGDPQPAIEPRDARFLFGDDGQKPAIPSGAKITMPETVLPALDHAAPAALDDAAPAAMKNMESSTPEIARKLDENVKQPAMVHQPMSSAIPGSLPAGHGVAPTLPAKQTGIDLPVDAPLEQSLAVALELPQSRNQAIIEVRQTELPKIGELDTSRRAAGLVHQYREADTRLEAGFAIVKTTYEAPTDRIHEFGASGLVEPTGFMAELLRADNILHVADVSIEQMDLYLDYMRGLAEESAGEPSRDRTALNEIFQAVKANIVDNLARTTEAQGEKILAGGGGPANGPNGEFVIRLSMGGVAGEGHEIAIPSMRVKDLSPDLFFADIRTREAAIAAIDHIELASADAVQTRDMIAEARLLIRQLMTMETARNGSRPPISQSPLGF